MVINSRFFNRSELIGFVALALVLFVILPLSLDIFRLNLVAKYLTYAFVGIGLVLCWGYGGILSLGQGVFFGLGGYCMAMYLKLEASSVANTKIQSTPGIPDFMDWNQITEIPLFWKPFHSFPLTVLAILVVPALFALIIGAAMFKRRVGGVYFAIITQAVAAILTILIVGQQGYTGGINGITDLRTLHGWDIRTDHAKFILYFVEVVLLFGCILVAQFIRLTKLGRILVAMREQEDRVRFSGYSVANFKIFAFCAAAVFASIGGAMFTLEIGFMSPSFVGIVPSIEMVIYTALSCWPSRTACPESGPTTSSRASTVCLHHASRNRRLMSPTPRRQSEETPSCSLDISPRTFFSRSPASPSPLTASRRLTISRFISKRTRSASSSARTAPARPPCSI
jgi:urea transport system permease protein